jgi:hypothetical protein
MDTLKSFVMPAVDIVYLDLFREFKKVKRIIKTDTTGKVNLTIPFATINSRCESQYIPFDVVTIPYSFSRITRRVPLMEHDLFTFHLYSFCEIYFLKHFLFSKNKY